MNLQNKAFGHERRMRLNLLLQIKPLIRVIEVHNGISSLIGENSFVMNGAEKKEFDALWISSLTDSVAKGYPDEEIVSIDSRLTTVNQILNVTSKPIIYDADTGGFIEQLNYLIQQLERIGVSAMVIEDKKYPKSNSLLESACHKLEDRNVFVEKIKYAQKTKRAKDFLVIARIESLICGETQAQALERAVAYLNAGADAIMIHSKSDSPEQILEFSKNYNQLNLPNGRKPLMCVPTTYHTVKEEDLIKNGFNIVLYANQQLRSAFKAMKQTCEKILQSGRATEVEDLCASLKEILEPVGSARTYDAEYAKKGEI